jgi:hypothetical protein
VRRNPGHARPRAGFSPGWVVVSYFLICGGLCAAIAGYALTRTSDPYVIGAALFVGAGLGGFLAGRASPHRSYLEPVLAAALVVASFVAFVYSTPLGRLVVEMHKDQVVRSAAQLGGVGALGGFLGALVGEATQPPEPGGRFLGWLVHAIFVAAGALFAAVTAAALLLLNEAAQAALAQSWTGGVDPSRPLISEDRVTLAAAVSGALGAFLAGLVTQLGAPRRVLVPAALAAALVIGGAVLAIGWAAQRVDELVGPAAFFAGVAAALALVGALAAFLLGRATGRLSRGGVSE